MAAIASYVLSGDLPLPAYALGSDTWFEGDLGRVVLAMTSPAGGDATHRSGVHPLFILLTHPPAVALRVLGWGQLTAARTEIAGIAGLWLASLYVVLRLVGLRRPDATIFALVGGASAAAAFWLTVPESYGLGSMTMVLAVGLVALTRYRKVPAWAWVAASAGSLSITTTNWMAGLAAAVASHPLRRAAVISLEALAVVLVAWGLQKALFPDVDFFIGNVEKGSHQFLSARSRGPSHVLRVGYLFSEVMPNQIIRKDVLSIQRTPLGAYGSTGAIAAALWGILLAMGAWALIRAPVLRAFRIALALTLAGQTLLILVYGSETFLYALNLTVLLVLVSGLAATTRLRPLALTLALVVAVCGAINNYSLRSAAAARARQLLPPSQTAPFAADQPHASVSARDGRRSRSAG